MSKYKFEKYYDLIIKMKNEKKSNKDILLEINDENLTINKLYKIFYRLNLSKSKYNEKYRSIDEKAIDMINKGISHREIARILNVDQQSLSLRLKKFFNIHSLPDGKKKIDSNIFNTIDTEEKAYWLGMMYADGYIDENRGSFELCLKDNEHVEKFKFFLKSDHKINKKNVKIKNKTNIYYRISIRDKTIVSDLVRLGCHQKKSLTLNFPTENQVPSYLIRHFLRGYVDGDGSIGISSCKYPQATFSIIGTKSFLEKCINIFSENLDINITKTLKSEGRAFSKNITGNIKALKIIKYLYDDCNIFLNRKYDKYIKIAALRQKSQKS